MNDVKKNIDQGMGESELTNLLSDSNSEMLKNLVMCEPEIEQIQKMVNSEIGQVESLAKSN